MANIREVHHGFGEVAFAILLCLLSAFPVWCQSVPEFYGIYANVDGKLASMMGGKGNFAPSQLSLQVLDYYRGSSGMQRTLSLQGNSISFVVFDIAVADVSATVELYKLPYARNEITRPGAVGALLGQVSGHPQGNSTSPLNEYIVAKTDGFNIPLLQKPVVGQPQMVQLVPASKLAPGVYCLFAIRKEGGQTMIYTEIFKWNGGSDSATTQLCIDMLHTGGFGGLVEDHDARLEHPYFLAKDNYISCDSGAGSGAVTSTSLQEDSRVPADCGADFGNCMKGAIESEGASNFGQAIADYKAAAEARPKFGEPWLEIGYLQLIEGRFEAAKQSFSKSADLGFPVALHSIEHRSFSNTSGTLSIGRNEVKFMSRGKEVFRAPLSQVSIGGTGLASGFGPDAFYFELRVAGKKHRFEYQPQGVSCAFSNGNNLICDGNGINQQKAVAEWVKGAIARYTAESAAVQ